MAPRTNPSGGKKPDKLWHHAIMRAVKRPINEIIPPNAPVLEVLAYRLVQKGLADDVSALKELGDRLDGKSAQSIGIGQADDLEPLEATVRPQMTREQWLKTHS